MQEAWQQQARSLLRPSASPSEQKRPLSDVLQSIRENVIQPKPGTPSPTELLERERNARQEP